MKDFKKFRKEFEIIEAKVIERCLIDGSRWRDIAPGQAANSAYPVYRVLSLRHYNERNSNYKEELDGLKKNAFIDISLLGQESIKNIIQHLAEIAEDFTRLIKNCSGFHADFRNNVHSDFELKQKFIHI